MDLQTVIQKCNEEQRAHAGSPSFVFGVSGSHGWDQRINTVKESPDNKLIPKHELAGKVVDGILYLHNGIKMYPESYYGHCMLRMLMENEGVHEPQEEKAFAEVLQQIPKGGVMIELGCYWSFYSMWFKKENGGKTIMVEPDAKHLEFGKRNFQLNGMEGNFYNKFVSSQKSEHNISVDDIFELENLDRVNICHSDIQGFELEMLLGCQKNLQKIDYFFISTHGNPYHYGCIEFLEKNNFEILCSANESETYSVDGLIVARSKSVTGPSTIEISKR